MMPFVSSINIYVTVILSNLSQHSSCGANMAKCKSCGNEFNETDIYMHMAKAHGDVNAVQFLKPEEREEILKKVIVRNLYLSQISEEMIALQVDLDVPTVLKIIEEIKKW